MPSFAVILPAAGRSSRFRDQNYKKVYAPLDGRPVWLHSVERFQNRPDVKQTIVVISPDDREDFFARFGANVAILGIEVVEGGQERADSVERALAKVRPEIDFVAVHDAARPCLAEAWIDAVFAAAVESQAAILATPVAGTLKRVANGRIEETVSRERLYEAQTPQVFARQLLLDAYAGRGDFQPTDESQLIERTGKSVRVVEGSPLNLKITTKDDLRLAALALKALPKPSLDNPLHPFADGDLWR
ncbi:2-C-methyl-D-erythritol 4-phosphate cytidylyltransferase [Lignipirellula cremea]|uniref:2-C-methyl-D-erythritol 4-phosphate cytidylyltransferase n=1 Tax=Lignipirellula cremea TaxID=2528010 RepID=A0A518DR93_9BACT|nr:2-C-methyl-D-erythritol 4-phosphate cytidylyltransferase [Lignipirellula cremea]QDU94353.1 2-C-methyl-D-erythritol 4-phosphate cytidylyltransferase [Lignipirellula cremea]